MASAPPVAPVSSRACTLCQGRQYLIEREQDRAVARACECSKDCRECKGTGFVYVTREETFSAKVGPKKYEVVDLCRCRLLGKRLDAFREAQIPGVLASATFENYRAYNEKQEEAKRVATAFTFAFSKGKPNKGFVLSGPVGTGKTHLLTATLGHLVLERGIRARYLEISLLYADIRRGFNEGKSGGEIIAPLSQYEVLAIDELGKGRGSQFELETLDELIARRYNAGRTTLFTTNYSLAYEKAARLGGAEGFRTEDMKKVSRESDLLRERVGERIYSRLCEMCDFVEFPSGTKDFRRAKQEGDSSGPRAMAARANR